MYGGNQPHALFSQQLGQVCPGVVVANRNDRSRDALTPQPRNLCQPSADSQAVEGLSVLASIGVKEGDRAEPAGSKKGVVDQGPETAGTVDCDFGHRLTPPLYLLIGYLDGGEVVSNMCR
jgi:hypothetical protein